MTVRGHASLQGFAPAKASNVLLELGQVLKINLTLKVGDMTESVQVTGEAPLIDAELRGRRHPIGGHRSHDGLE